MQQIKEDVDEHNRPINNTLDIIAELVETGADVLSSAELNKLQSEGKNLKNRYDNVADNSDKLLKRLVAGLEELSKFRGEVSAFRSWLEKAYKILEDKEKQLADLRNAAGNTGDLKAFVSDVMTHGADLKFLTISGQKFVDLSKVNITLLQIQVLTFLTSGIRCIPQRIPWQAETKQPEAVAVAGAGGGQPCEYRLP